jgi:hypothetical protein
LDDEDDISKNWRDKTCCRRAPPTGVDGAAYLLVGEEAFADRELKWEKMLARNLSVSESVGIIGDVNRLEVTQFLPSFFFYMSECFAISRSHELNIVFPLRAKTFRLIYRGYSLL